ncbi:MAG: biotin transporter BioY [Treponema sp.]|nr:biotin transporter BioY [Treponema sp.]
MNKSKIGSASIFTALFAALTCAGCFISIPLPGGVPVVLQDMMAMITGLLLGPIYGTAAVLVFLIIGCLGLPVFSGKAGLHVITQGVTGGFLVGYLVSAFVGGLFLWFFLNPKKEHGKAKQWILVSAAAVLATVVVFAIGIAGFMRVTHKPFSATLGAVLTPFIPGNILKLVVMIPLTVKFRPVLARYMGLCE